MDKDGNVIQIINHIMLEIPRANDFDRFNQQNIRNSNKLREYGEIQKRFNKNIIKNGGVYMLYAEYDAIDVAEYVLWYCDKKLNRPISNLRLQKTLYYIQGEYLYRFHKPLFEDDIEAWDYGPVVPDVYYRYNGYIGDDIRGIVPLHKNLFNEEEIDVIQYVVKKTIKRDVWELVNDTRKEDPWKNNYIKGYCNEISLEDMENWFYNKEFA